MPRFTSIQGLGKEYYLKLFPTLTKVLGGDTCASAIVSVFDFLTTALAENLHAAGEDSGLLWIEVTLDRLAWMMDGMYCTRRIQERIEWLAKMGLTVVPTDQKFYGRETSTRLKFLLNTELLSTSISSGKVFNLKAADICQQNTSNPSIDRANTRDPLTIVGGLLTIVSETPEIDPIKSVGTLDLNTESRTRLTPSLENLPENQPTDPDGLSAVMSQLRRNTKAGRIKGKELATLEEKLPGLLAANSGEEVLDAFRAFLQDEYWSDKKYPVYGFVSQFSRYRENSPRPAAPAGDRALPGAAEDPQHPLAPQRAPEAPQRDFPGEWNSLVTEALVDPTLMGPRPKVYSDPVFADRFTEICLKAQVLILAGADLKFGFLLKTVPGTGRYRWQELLAGELEWMKTKRKSKSRESDNWDDDEVHAVRPADKPRKPIKVDEIDFLNPPGLPAK